MENSFEIIQIMMPLFVCMATGFFTLSQIRAKRKDEQLFNKLDEIEKGYQETNRMIHSLSMKDKTFDHTVNYMQEYLTINEETIKRIEIALLIMTNPDQTLAIEQLLESYNGNHYIYDIVTKWVSDYKVTINPRILNKLCRNSTELSLDKIKEDFIKKSIHNFEQDVKTGLSESCIDNNGY